MSRWYEYAPEWIAAASTGGAFLVAGLAFRTATRDRHFAQARRVQAYLTRPVYPYEVDQNGPSGISLDKYAAWHDDGLLSYDGFGHSFSIDNDAAIATVTLHNKSPEFAHSLEVTLTDETGADIATMRVATIAPETTLPLIAVLKEEPRMYGELTITLCFTDATGRAWISQTGRPVREDRTGRWRSLRT